MGNSNLKNTIYVNGWRNIKGKLHNHSKLYSIAMKGYSGYCKLLSPVHSVLPNFLMIGVLKSGTTSLYEYLIKHPSVFSCLVKEPHYFNKHYFDRSIEWYKFCFPTNWTKYYTKNIQKKKFLTGEASATYYYSPHVPKRVKQLIPNTKFILVLRNPVERAYSMYSKMVYHKLEKLSFDEDIEKENERISNEFQKMIEDETYFSEVYFQHAYLDQGVYVNKIKNWLEYFPIEQFLFINNDNLLRTPDIVYQKVLDFLELPKWRPEKFGKYNVFEKSEMNSETRKKLVEFFKPHNEELYKLLGVNYNWN